MDRRTGGGDAMDSYLTAEISASAVRDNLALLRKRLGVGTKLCAVVKADCYGHGVELLLGAVSGSADCLAVAAPQEAMQLRSLGYERPILMFFSPCAYPEGQVQDALAKLISESVTLTVASPDEVDAIARVAERLGAEAQVHVKIDSGMWRSGVAPDDAAALVAQVRAAGGVKLTGLYTHFATADSADKTFTHGQLESFLSAVQACGGPSGLTLHAANSAAAIDLPESHLDMVRTGIAIYGCHPSDQLHNRLPLRPAMRLTGRLIQVKNVPAGGRCGYGLTYTFDRDARVGLVPVGYADGYFRCLSNRAAMRIAGRDVPIRGRVSMDQTIIDLTEVPQARVGDEVEIVSADPSAPHSVENLARLAGTIPYEITCRLNAPRIHRVLVD